jgi:hypothetical protein
VRRSLVAALALVCATGLAGCRQDFAWKEAIRIDSGAPTHFFLRKNGELWGWGANAARRTSSGWAWVNACALSDGAAHALSADGAVSLAFSSDGVWALCNGQQLLHWTNDGAHTEVALPAGEHAFGLATLEDGFVLAAAGGFYTFDGAGWQKIATNGGPGDPGSFDAHTAHDMTGFSLHAFYSGGGGGAGNLMFWNGSNWSQVSFSGPSLNSGDAASGVFDLRAGKVYDGYFELNGAQGVSHLPEQAMTARPTASFFSMLDDGSFLFETGWPSGPSALHDPFAFLWKGAPGDSDLTYLGGDSVQSPSLPADSLNGWYAINDRLIVFATPTLLIEGTR